MLEKNQRSYKSFKEFFDKVNESIKIEEYTYAYVLLFSYFEDRVLRIFETQSEVKYGVKPTEDDYRCPIHHKLRKCNKWGLTPEIKHLQFNRIDLISKRRNAIIHDALFHINSVTLDDVEYVKKVGRYFEKVRRIQKKENPKLFPTKKMMKEMKVKTTPQDRLKLKFDGMLPSLSSMREVKNLNIFRPRK